MFKDKCLKEFSIAALWWHEVFDFFSRTEVIAQPKDWE